jgi:uncharacterized protein with HEPN domain
MKESRRPRPALRDILEAIHEIREITAVGTPIPQLGKIPLNALLKISEAVRHLPDELKATRPDMGWSEIGRLGNRLRHDYFRVDLAIISSIVAGDVPALQHTIETFWRDLGYGDLPKLD